MVAYSEDVHCICF